MTDSASELERQLNELKGAIDLLFELREEAVRWVEEAEDGSKREAFENVLGHIEALESEYRNRQEQLQKKAKSA
jgi:HPt (histidine-containing phosphotransfer) domain-containing protein